MANAKERVALTSVFASAFMTVAKLAVGLSTGSLGILSEAAHSLLDLGAASLTWVAVRIGDQPADEGHPYGHAKVESVSALIETGLLFLTSAWIVKEAVGRLLSDNVHVEATWYGAAVILLSIAIDFGRARALSRVAKATGSQALEADALHFSSDILSSAVVLLGLGMVAIGWPKGDALAAIGVACFVLVAGWRLGRRTIDVLIDAAPLGVAGQVRSVIAALPDVARVDSVRARPAGAVIQVEAVVKVSRALALERVEAARRTIRAAVAQALPNVDLLVVAEPLTLDDESVGETVRVAAAGLGLGVHDVRVYTHAGRCHVGFDLEVDDCLSIAEAHDLASVMEARLAAELGGDVGIDIHIDPRRSLATEGEEVDAETRRQVAAAIEDVVAAHPAATACHHLYLEAGADGLYIAFHCRFPRTMPLRAVHDATAGMEQALRQRIPQAARIVIHAEPEGGEDD